MKPLLGGGSITLDYGVRRRRYAAGYHTGRDYRAITPRKCSATASGRVVFIGRYGGWGSSYGKHVIIETGGIRHAYCHLSRISVQAGQQVRTGQLLGYTGMTGNITGPHLHYEERRAPYSYWDHRRPRLDVSQPAVWDVSDIADSARVEPGTRKSYHPTQVKSVALAMNKAGLLSRANVTGHWSRAKRAAYKKWEVKNGWKPTGIPGPQGLKLLRNRYAPGTIVRG